ncbi:MAG: TRAP transporter small permease [candidate division NC10 bacterium]|nr:TRAP transporter small permease [candidate division NC10 bacterium]
MFQRVSDVLRRGTELVVMVLMAILVVIVVASVFFRYILISPLTWSEEVGRYLMIWLGFLAASIAIRDGLHVGVDFVVQWSPPGIAVWLRRLGRAALAVFLLIVTSYGFILVANLWDQWSPVLTIRMTWPYLAIPVGSLLMLVQLFMPARSNSDAHVVA